MFSRVSRFIPPRPTKASSERERVTREKIEAQKRAEKAALKAIPKRSSSVSRRGFSVREAPAPPNSLEPVKRSSSDPTRFRRLIEERSVQEIAQKQHGGIAVSIAVQFEIEALQKGYFSYPVFKGIIGDPREQLTTNQVTAIWRKLSRGRRSKIRESYIEELSQYPISVSKIRLGKSFSVQAYERGLQAINNLWVLSCAVDRQFRRTFLGSPNKMIYFLELLYNETWLETVEELDFTFEAENENSIGLTRVCDILAIQFFPALQRLILAGHRELRELPEELNMPILRHLDISDTSFKDFPEGFGKDCPLLEELHCRNSLIRFLPLRVQKNLAHLKIFDAAGCVYLVEIERNRLNPKENLAAIWIHIEEIDLTDTNILSFSYTFPSHVKICLGDTARRIPVELQPRTVEVKERPKQGPQKLRSVLSRLSEFDQSTQAGSKTP